VNAQQLKRFSVNDPAVLNKQEKDQAAYVGFGCTLKLFRVVEHRVVRGENWGYSKWLGYWYALEKGTLE
jgi:hypothetical protein